MNWQKSLARYENEARKVLKECGAPIEPKTLIRYQARTRYELAAQLVVINATWVRKEAECGRLDEALNRLLVVCEHYDEMTVMRAVPEYREHGYITQPGWPRTAPSSLPCVITDMRFGSKDRQRVIKSTNKGAPTKMAEQGKNTADAIFREVDALKKTSESARNYNKRIAQKLNIGVEQVRRVRRTKTLPTIT